MGVFAEFTPSILLIAGLIAILIPLLTSDELVKLKKTGEKTEGIVFDQEEVKSNSVYIDHHIHANNKITIRFLTKSNEWITAEVKQPFAFFFFKQYQTGQKIEVYYNPENPSKFYVDSMQSDSLGRFLFLIIGFMLFGIGVYQLIVQN